MPSTQPDTHHGENTHTPVVRGSSAPVLMYICMSVCIASLTAHFTACIASLTAHLTLSTTYAVGWYIALLLHRPYCRLRALTPMN